jgi:hypothetical protein
MEDQLDLEFREDALEEAAIQDRTGDLPFDAGGDRLFGWPASRVISP